MLDGAKMQGHTTSFSPLAPARTTCATPLTIIYLTQMAAMKPIW